mgnify:CR=1 FL=1
MKKISYFDIKKKLESVSIDFYSSLADEVFFNSINSISNSTENDLSFFSNVKYLDLLKKCKAKACIINKVYSKYLPKNCVSIIVDEPYLVLAHLTELFAIEKKMSNGFISKLSSIDSNSNISTNVQIDHYSSIGSNTSIGKNVIIGSNSNIGPNVVIEDNSIINDNVSIINAIIKKNCEIKSGARIGHSGFGFEEKSKKKITHIGNVIVDKNSTIGSNTTIDRAVFETTYVGEFSQIDNLVQIAHNVVIGNHAIIAAQVGIAGSTIIGNYVKIGGQAGISGHLKIGNNVTIAAKSGVTKNILDDKIVAGFPAKDINLWKRDIIKLGKKL